MKPTQPRAAVYVRVSTRDKGQSVENQRPVLEELARSKGYRVIKIYEDQETGGPLRPGFRQMLTDAEAHKFDVVLFWSLDRFTREGSYPTLEYLNRLAGWGVGYCSHQEQYLDTMGPFKDAVIAILGAIAKQEKERISERVKAGLVRAKMNGRRLGKPFKVPDLDAFARANSIYSVEELQAFFRCSRSTIFTLRRALRERDALPTLHTGPDAAEGNIAVNTA